MIDKEHSIADSILKEIEETVNTDERDKLLIQYQRICQASKERADSDLMTFEICEKVERDEKRKKR
jgi:hypothetical protein